MHVSSVVDCDFSRNCASLEAPARGWNTVRVNRKRFDAESNLIDRNESRNSHRVQIEESNGLSKARVTSVKRNYVYQACIDRHVCAGQPPFAPWIEHDKQQARHSGLECERPPSGMRSGESETRLELSKMRWRVQYGF